ncbi:nicotinate-nucleotide pyrophosphorylase (carboxylating) [Paenochrobactrum gallinarii]|uniref:Probable nicotinate-nucleotide pyrophosphorylase [carboxylating] n=1 Tax=Paenochrobactrum gallinarii TaxID=643673 RepID=A0A841LRE0_9HYPH|nr:carboxylating nicotinate-nucleotide diphosphorylase [Paenochrobactrum gallinarii]MBB6260633.1 nicotinate-nucleotide pyrophosphorylase (carboxylating) [Paenochrobactrum gallinarii]
MTLSSLPRFIVEPLVRATLAEDLGLAGDITSSAVIPADHRSTMVFRSRSKGVIAGLDLAALSFELVDPSVKFSAVCQDGDVLEAGAVIAKVSGLSRSLLMAERTALNLLGHLSGIATVTHDLMQAVSHTKAHVTCTRKTMPGLRALEKYAVRAGGAKNHRFALYDAVLIKDNHVAVAGGVGEAIKRARANVGHMVKIEVEVDTLAQLHEAMAVGVDAVLLDNMPPEMLAEAVKIVDGRAITEASGGITPATAVAIAESGVDLLSIGWLTHSAPNLDIGLDFEA